MRGFFSASCSSLKIAPTATCCLARAESANIVAGSRRAEQVTTAFFILMFNVWAVSTCREANHGNRDGILDCIRPNLLKWQVGRFAGQAVRRSLQPIHRQSDRPRAVCHGGANRGGCESGIRRDAGVE